MSENNGNPSNERKIKDMKGLLKFCMTATQSEDAPPSTCDVMSEENRKWLDEALTNMSVSPVKVMSDCLKTIENAEVDTEEGTEEQLRALGEIIDWVEDLDLALDFLKINGLRIVPKLLTSEVSELRWTCLELIATLCQNNPQAQKSVLDLKLLPVVLELLRSDPNPTVRVKSLYALSCLARSNIFAQKEFLANGGLTILADALMSKEEKLKIKAMFMISGMCHSNPALKDTFLDGGLVQQMVLALKGDHCESHEHLMSALLSLVASHTATKEFCSQENLGLKPFLVSRINFLEGNEAFEEERGYAQDLLSALDAASTCNVAPSSSNALLPV